MEDSSQFMQWALSTLQHDELPPATPAAAAAYDDNGCNTFSPVPALRYSASVNSMVPEEPPAQEGQRATNSWSSVDTDSGSGGGGAAVTAVQRDAWSPSQQNSANNCATPRSSGSGTNQPVSWDFNSASAQLIKEAQHNSATAAARAAESAGGDGGVPQYGSPRTRRASARISASSSSAPYSQDHIIAERKRREKINQRFIELSTVIPGLKKMDKATILSDATRYVKELQEKMKALQQDGRGMESSAVLAKRPCIAVAAPDGDEDGGGPSCAAAGHAETRNNALPEIEVRISDSNVLMRIHCDDTKGVLVRLLAEIEGLHLSITQTNVMPFSSCILIINIMAKVEQGFNATADDIVGRLNALLQQGVRTDPVQKSWLRLCCSCSCCSQRTAAASDGNGCSN